MSESIHITASNKEGKYKELVPQVKSLLQQETDPVANMANFCAVLKYSMHFFWVGFYLIKNNELVLGPFQGPLACTRIQKGRGVCGSAWQKAETIVVPNVDEFPGHIACSSLSKSEIVLPVFNSNNQIVGVLDVDSDELNSFDDCDKKYLSELLSCLKF
ncbi:MAG: GAF domain-containing protein [Bacteroidia bacterium]|nr:GAF domain-containing protein [Bacteroidia bacterium]